MSNPDCTAGCGFICTCGDIDYSRENELAAETTRLRQQLADVELIANEIEQLFVDGDKMKLMSLVPLGKIVRLKKSLAQIRELEK